MKLIFYLIFASMLPLWSIDLNLPVSSMHNAASGLSLIHSTPASSAVNPAVFYSGLESSISQLFGLSELPYYNLHAGYSFGKLNLHLGQSYLDHELYIEGSTQLSLNYNWRSISAGIALRRLYNKVRGYHEASAFLTDAGIMWHFDKFSSALAVRNVTQTKFLGLSLPLTILWESCYQFSANSRISVGLEKQDEFDFSFRFAAKYQPFSLFSILAGYQFEPDRIGLGTVFHLQRFYLGYSVRTHQYLDLTHYISIGYEIQD